MTDPDIRRWLGHETKQPVGHLSREDYAPDRLDKALARGVASGRQILVCAAIEAGDLRALAGLAARSDLFTGGSGIALGLPAALGCDLADAASWQGENGPAPILSGSYSRATRGQVEAHIASDAAACKLDTEAIVAGAFDVDEAIGWAMGQYHPLLYTSADPRDVAAAQARHGPICVADAFDDPFANLARAAVDAGVTRLIAARGETSGAVVFALEAAALAIGPRITAGVPAVRVQGLPLVLALKSGNFGGPDLFAQALEALRCPL